MLTAIIISALALWVILGVNELWQDAKGGG